MILPPKAKNARQKAKSTIRKVAQVPVILFKKVVYAIIKFFGSSKRIVLFSVLDLFVDLAFCILYLIEFQINVNEHNKSDVATEVPEWLRTYRMPIILDIAVLFSLWNLSSFAVRMIYVLFILITQAHTLVK